MIILRIEFIFSIEKGKLMKNILKWFADHKIITFGILFMFSISVFYYVFIWAINGEAFISELKGDHATAAVQYSQRGEFRSAAVNWGKEAERAAKKFEKTKDYSLVVFEAECWENASKEWRNAGLDDIYARDIKRAAEKYGMAGEYYESTGELSRAKEYYLKVSDIYERLNNTELSNKWMEKAKAISSM